MGTQRSHGERARPGTRFARGSGLQKDVGGELRTGADDGVEERHGDREHEHIRAGKEGDAANEPALELRSDDLDDAAQGVATEEGLGNEEEEDVDRPVDRLSHHHLRDRLAKGPAEDGLEPAGCLQAAEEL